MCKRQKKMQFCYLVERRRDGERFLMFGDLKQAWLRPKALFQFVPSEFEYAKETPFGFIRNISCDFRYNSKEYRVVRQTAVPLV